MSALAPTLEKFFTQRLLSERRVSPNTVAAYRDTFRLLLAFVAHTTGTAPSQLDLAALDADLIATFLEHLERDRANSVRTRNARLAAIRSLFRFAAMRHPEHAQLIQRILAIPAKRTERTEVSFLTPGEVDALLAAPDRTTRLGRRDHAWLVLTAQTGLRVSETLGLRTADVCLDSGAHVRCHGKGRKERDTPLTVLTRLRQLGPLTDDNLLIFRDRTPKGRHYTERPRDPPTGLQDSSFGAGCFGNAKSS